MTIETEAEAVRDERNQPHSRSKGGIMSMLRAKLKSKPFIIVLISVIGLIVLCYGGYAYLSALEAANRTEVSGRIEADETHILAATGTRVLEVKVREGDVVKKGQLLVTLDSGNLEERVKGADKVLSQARTAQAQASRQVRAVQSNINEARRKSKGFWTRVFTSPKGRAKKADQLRGQMMQAKMMQFQAATMAGQAKAAIEQGQSKVSYFKLTSPIDGIVTVRSAEPGEIVGQGQVLLTVVDPESSYMRGFIAEVDLAKVNIGQVAEVDVGREGEKPLKGKVVSIDPKPSFTPQNVYFKDDRVRQVYGVKIALSNAGGIAKPGMRADAVIRRDDGRRD